MNRLWIKVIQFLAKAFGVQVVPPEVANQDACLSEWWEIYRSKAPWLPYKFITADAVRRERKRLTLNPAKIACAELAGLVLAEQPDVTGPIDILESNNFWANFRRSFEYQAALGGQAIKLYKHGDTIGIDFVKAYNFIPLTWDNVCVTEGSFIDRRVKGSKSYIRIETHRKTDNGYLITSQAFDEQTNIETSLDDLWPGIEPSVTVETKYPTFVYIQNPEANNVDPESPLGMSIFANSIDTIKALDITFDSLNTEITMGRQRVVLPSNVMRGYIDPDSGARRLGFDPTDEAYIRLEGDDADGFKPVDLSGQLRITEYKDAIQTLLNLFAVQIGFDAGYFSFDGKSMKTATEVISENSHTYKTIQAYRDVIKTALTQLFNAINELSGGTESVNITFDDGVIEDRNSKTKYYTDLYNAGLVSQAEAIAAIRGIDIDSATKIADVIKKDKVQVTASNIFGPGL